MLYIKKPFKIIPIISQALLYWPPFLLFKIFCRFAVVGKKNVRNLETGIIFASNHVSEWDGPLIRIALPFFSKKFSPMYYVAKTKEFYDNSGWRRMLYGGLLFKLLGAYPVYSGKKNYAYSLQHYVEILKSGGNVCIFPEGVRSQDGTIGAPHGGVTFLAHTTGALVAPVAIKGTLGLTARDFVFRTRRVSVVFGQPLRPAELVPKADPSVSDFKSGAVIVMKEVEKLLK